MGKGLAVGFPGGVYTGRVSLTPFMESKTPDPLPLSFHKASRLGRSHLGFTGRSAVRGLGGSCLSAGHVSRPFLSPCLPPDQQRKHHPKYPPFPDTDQPWAQARAQGAVYTAGGSGPSTQGTQSLDRGQSHVWTHCLHPSPCLHVLGPRCVGVTGRAWPGHSPNTPPAQATPGKNLAATVIGPWTSIKTAGHTPQTAPTSPIPQTPREMPGEGTAQGQGQSSFEAVLTGVPFSPAGPGGPWGPGLPGIPMGPAAPAGPLSPGDPWGEARKWFISKALQMHGYNLLKHRLVIPLTLSL